MTSGNGSRLGALPANPTLSYSVPLGRVLARKQTRDGPSALEQSLHGLKIAVTQLRTGSSCAQVPSGNNGQGLLEVGKHAEGKISPDMIRDHLMSTHLFKCISGEVLNGPPKSLTLLVCDLFSSREPGKQERLKLRALRPLIAKAE